MATVLDLELYEVTIAADVLQVPQSTLRWWLEGGTRRGRVYQPVLRPVPTGSAVMTWGEVVEAGYLAGYRKQLRVQLWRLRDLIEVLREELGVAYPLATARPWVGPGRRLLVETADSLDLSPDLRPGFIEPATGQGVLSGIAEQFLASVEFEPPNVADGVAARIRPLGTRAPIVIDPLVRFGVPTVGGVSTHVLAEKVAAGEMIEGLAEAYALEVTDVAAAVSYEKSGWPLRLAAA